VLCWDCSFLLGLTNWHIVMMFPAAEVIFRNLLSVISDCCFVSLLSCIRIFRYFLAFAFFVTFLHSHFCPSKSVLLSCCLRPSFNAMTHFVHWLLRYASCGKHKNGYHLPKYLNGFTFLMVMLFILCELGTEDFFTMSQQPPVGRGTLIVQASRSHSDTPHSVGLLLTSDQPDAETFTW